VRCLQTLFRGQCSQGDHKNTRQKGRMDLTRKKKERSLCPHCTETCSTPWNLKIHIQRKHSENGQPTRQGLDSTRTQLASGMNNMPINDSYYHRYPNHHEPYPTYSSTSDLPVNNLREESRVRKTSDAREKLNETLRDAFELVKLTRPTFGQKPAMEAGVSWPFGNFSTAPQLSNNKSRSIIGFQGGICENCFSSFFYEVSDKPRMIPRTQGKLAHTCDAKNVSDAKFVLDIQSKKEQAHTYLTNMLLQTVLRIITWSGRRTISLKAEELVPASYSSGLEYTENNLQLDGNTEASLISTKEEDHIDIDLEEISENHWANHIFKEKGQGDERSIVLRIDELLDFIHTTKATFGTFRIKIGDDSFRAERYFLLYIVF
jgi:hypothetical protein